MAGYGPYSEDELNLQYSLRNVRPGYEKTMIPAWQERSHNYREKTAGNYDIRYGAGERDFADYFPTTNPNGGLIVYIHGGYWQRGDKSIYSFIAEPYNKAGFSVIAINYMLCPKVKIAAIPPQCRRAVVWAWENAETFRANRDKFFVMGHSAGAHLTAWMMSTDWSQYETGYPTNLIKACAPISGLYDFEPIRHTSENRGVGTNEGFGLNIESAEEAQSVSLNAFPPKTKAPHLLGWGSKESAEFVRQNKEHYERLVAANIPVKSIEVPGQDHFDLCEVMGNEESELVTEIISLFKKYC